MTSHEGEGEGGRDRSFATRMPRIVFAFVRLAIGFGIILYLAKSGIIDWSAFSALLTRWPLSVTAIVLLLFDVAMMALRLCWLLHPLGLRLSWYDSAQLTLVGFFFATFLPGAAGGDLARIFYAAKGNGGRRSEIITVLLLERSIGLFSLLVLPLLFAPMFPALLRMLPIVRVLLIITAVLGAALLGIFLVLLFHSTVMNLLARKTRGLFPRVGAEQIVETFAVYRRNPRTLLAALGISLVANLSLVAVTALGALTLDPTSWSMKMCMLIPMGHVVNSLPLTPGGLGIGETAFNSLFKIAGLRGGAEALLCFRIWKALVSILGLAVYLGGFKLNISNIPHDV